MENKYIIPAYLTKDDIKRIRENLKLTQKEFSGLISTSKSKVERWEMSNDKISGPIVGFLYMLENNIADYKKLIIPAKSLPLRLYYMYKQYICTIIDVDDNFMKIEIHNYTNKVMFRAFGVNENPTYNDYKDFLKERCFPETRDKMKLVLNDLGLPFYDPFMIIKKTEGRMADDDFWIKIEE